MHFNTDQYKPQFSGIGYLCALMSTLVVQHVQNVACSLNTEKSLKGILAPAFRFSSAVPTL